MHKLAFGLLWLLVFAIPWENSVAISGFGTISRAIGTMAFGVGILAALEKGKLRLPNRSHLLMGGFFLWAYLSSFWSVVHELDFQRIFTYAQLLAMVWLIWERAPTDESLNALLQAYVLGAYICAFSVISHYVTGEIYFIEHEWARYTATGFDPNDSGTILALGVPIAWYLSTQHRQRIMRLLSGLYLPIALASVLLTASRGAFLTLLAGILFIPWIYSEHTTRQKLGASVVIAATAFGMWVLAPSVEWDRLSTIPFELQGGIANRRYIWEAGLNVFRQYPVFGVGVGNFPRVVGAASHNGFLSILIELGIIGFGLFCALIASLILSTRHMPSLSRKFWSILYLAWGTGAMSLTWEYRKPTWLLFGLLVAYSAAAGQREQEGKVPAEQWPYARDHRRPSDIAHTSMRESD